VNRHQCVVLGIAATNLLLILLFPPFDQHSIVSAKIPVFAGFYFAFAPPPNSQVNTGVLTLETVVLLINAAISWLLLRRWSQSGAKRRFSLQNVALVFTGANLVLVLLFPPFESVFALTNAALPSFEGFYFIFSQKPFHIIVTALLYIEVTFILINGALFWLVFKERRHTPTPAEAQALAARLRGKP
jgi:hypothetical protein